MRSGKTKTMILCAMFVALIAVGAFIKIPVPVVPFTLQYLFTMLAGLLVIAFLISGIILFILNIKRIVIEEGEITLDKSVRFKTIYLNAGMILYLISCIAMFVITIITPAV